MRWVKPLNYWQGAEYMVGTTESIAALIVDKISSNHALVVNKHVKKNIKMVHNSCCVVNCKNTGRNSKCKFYTFPRASWKLEQRKKWINAVKRINVDGSSWVPKLTDTICSDHFIGGQKSETEISPSYIPTIFPSVYKKREINEETSISRHIRFLNRRKAKRVPTITTGIEVTSQSNDIAIDSMIDIVMDQNEQVDKDCQVDFLPNSSETGKTFICNRFMYVGADKCDAEIQTEMIDVKSQIIINRKKYKDKESNTPIKNVATQSTETSETFFLGFQSISKDEQLIDLAGVTFNNFKLLLKRTFPSHKCTVAKEDRLLIFLMKMKTGLTFSALGVLFSIHRTTVSRIFHTTLQTLAEATANLVFWPRIDVIKATMPKCF